jgi:hypothetical protein
VDELLGVGAIIAAGGIPRAGKRRTNEELEHGRRLNDSG